MGKKRFLNCRKFINVFSLGLYGKSGNLFLSALLILASFLSGLSLMFTPYMGDEIWALYLFGTQYLNDPELLFTRPISEISVWLGFGNFRPLGRFFEHLGYVGPIFFSNIINVAPADLYAFQRIILHLCFIFSVYTFTKLFLKKKGINGHYFALLSSIILISITLVNSANGGLRLFPAFYTTAYIIIIMCLMLILRFQGTKTSISKKAIFFLIGIVAATYNELTNLIIPLASLLVILFDNSNIFSTRIFNSLRFLSPLFLSFFAILIPIRIEIWRICSSTNCYSPSNLSFDSTLLPTVLNRVTSALPPVPQIQTSQWTTGITIGFWGILTTTILGIVVVLASSMIFRGLSLSIYPLYFPRLSIIFGLGTCIITATVMSLSSALQALDFVGVSWRETPLYFFGLSIGFLGLIAGVIQKPTLGSMAKRIVLGILCFALGLGSYTSASYNFKITKIYQSQEASLTTKKLEGIVMDSGRSESSVSELCLLLKTGEVFGENASAALLQGVNNYTLLRTDKSLCHIEEATP
jgi:hypothetical protein